MSILLCFKCDTFKHETDYPPAKVRRRNHQCKRCCQLENAAREQMEFDAYTVAVDLGRYAPLLPRHIAAKKTREENAIEYASFAVLARDESEYKLMVEERRKQTRREYMRHRRQWIKDGYLLAVREGLFTTPIGHYVALKRKARL